MDIKELIAQLLDKQRGQSAEMRVLLGSAAGTIENLLGQVDALKAELRDERHRHDRYVDFELAEAEELRKLKEKLRWIPVTERLPDELPKNICVWSERVRPSVDVLVKMKGTKNLYTAWYSYSNRDWTDVREEHTFNGVTHWMPLPEPPKGE